MTFLSSKFATLCCVVLIIIHQISFCDGFSTTQPSTLSIHHGMHSINNNRAYSKPAILRQHDMHSICTRAYTTFPAISYPCRQYKHNTISLQMGLLDFVKNNFLDSRDGDFIPLEKTNEQVFGPGPLIVAYAVPSTIQNDELLDMIEDGMPQRTRDEITIQRLVGMDKNGEGGDVDYLDCTVEDALDKAMKSDDGSSSCGGISPSISIVSSAEEQGPCPVLYFSGVINTEMMDTYNIIANEIYEETQGIHWPACAKVVPPAMKKSMRQVLTEISGDHQDAMRIRREESEKAQESNSE